MTNQSVRQIIRNLRDHFRAHKRKYLIGAGVTLGLPAVIGGTYALYDWATPDRPAIVKEIDEPYGKILDLECMRIEEGVGFDDLYPHEAVAKIHAFFGDERYLIIVPIESIDDETQVRRLYEAVGNVEQGFRCFGKVSIDRELAERETTSELTGLKELGVVLKPGNGETIVEVHNPDAIKWIMTYTRGRVECFPSCGDP